MCMTSLCSFFFFLVLVFHSISSSFHFSTLLYQNRMAPNPSSTSLKDSLAPPVASSVNGARLESSSSSDMASTKSAAVVAMEKPVIDKGNLVNCKEIKHKDGKVRDSSMTVVCCVVCHSRMSSHWCKLATLHFCLPVLM